MTTAAEQTVKDRLVVACCGCGRPVDLPAHARLLDAQPTRITYLSTCPNCKLTHKIEVTRA